MTCLHCAKRSVPQGSTTCGNSYCQEASYWANVGRNARRGSKREREAFERSRAAEMRGG